MNNLLTMIIEKLEKYKNIKIISFDIFDTILFRMVKKPEDIFKIAAKNAIREKSLPYYITSELYKNIRKEAEKRARKLKVEKYGHAEVNLKDIMDCMPEHVSNSKEKMITFELQTEKEKCYINPDIQEVIDYLVKKRKCKIVFTSDMYLSSKEICSILKENEFPVEVVDKFYISGEIGKSKATGQLYEYIIDDLSICAEDILHIGDNILYDVVNAKSIGIHTIYYDVISGNCMEIQMEQIKYGNIMPELYSLRRFISNKAKYLKEEKKQWFKTGAMVLGPIMSEIAEWVLDTAEKEQISTIYPLMREGKLITELLIQAASYRDKKYHISPMYISRRAVYLPSITKFDKSEYEKLTISLKKNGKVKNIFEMLEIQAESYIDDLLEISIEEVRKNKIVEERLKDYLFSKKVQSQILQSIESKRKNIYGYLKQLGIEQKFITVDVGFNGSIQEGLEKILFTERTSSAKNIHLLVFGSEKCIEKILDNVDIRAYAGSFEKKCNIVSEIAQRPYLLEQFMMCDCGTTVSYSKQAEKYIPVLKNISSILQQQYQNISYIQEGILLFQKYYLDLKKKKKIIIERTSNKIKEFTQIFLRLQTMPTLDEAKILGKLSYDENYGVDSVTRFADEKSVLEIKNIGIEKWLKSVVPGQKAWVESIVVQAQQEYYVDKALTEKSSDYQKSILEIVKKVFVDKPEKVIIAGAGEAGRQLHKYLELYGMKVEAFTDSNKKLWGSFIDEIPVKSLEENFDSIHFVIASFAFAEEISNQIRATKGSDIVIYSINI